jgi:hypothetical protein
MHGIARNFSHMGIKNMKISVVTTFHKKGYESYGQRMIQTFLKNWPSNIELHVYGEDCEITERADNLKIHDLHQASPELVAFKEKWKTVPKAVGQQAIPPIIPGAKKQAGIGFKWDAVRFSHKVYSIFHCAKICNSDVLLWMDADTVCHSPITIDALHRLVPNDKDLCFLGRRGKYTECGLYSMNLKSLTVGEFLKKFQELYDNADNGIFKLQEWHDSYVFDVVRKSMSLSELDWSGHLIKGEGHPLINSEWGAYLDHLKGARKDVGRSKSSDLLVSRTETYWR